MVNRRYCLLPNACTRWHIEIRTKKGATGFEGLFWSGPKRSGAVACSVCRFVCHGASRLPLTWKVLVRTRESSYLGPRASLHVNPFAQIARTNRSTVAFCNFIHTMPSPNPIRAPSRNIFSKILPRLSILSVSAPTDTWRRFEFLIFLSWWTDEYLLNLNRYFLIL